MRDHLPTNPRHGLALGVLVAAFAVLGGTPGASSAKPAKPCPPKLACRHGKPTKLWYRLSMSFNGHSHRTYGGGTSCCLGRPAGPIVDKSAAAWRLQSKHAVLVKRTCTRPATNHHSAETTEGPCPTGPGTKRLIDDITFSSAMEGAMEKNNSVRELKWPDSLEKIDGRDGELLCGRYREGWVQNGNHDLTGIASTAAASQGFSYGISMPENPTDATRHFPWDPIDCRFLTYDPETGTYRDPEPYTIPAASRQDYLNDVDRGRDAAYDRGTEWSGLIDFRFPPRRFGHGFQKSWHIESEEDVQPGLPPVQFDDSLKLGFEPCPHHGRDVSSCGGPND